MKQAAKVSYQNWKLISGISLRDELEKEGIQSRHSFVQKESFGRVKRSRPALLIRYDHEMLFMHLIQCKEFENLHKKFTWSERSLGPWNSRIFLIRNFSANKTFFTFLRSWNLEKDFSKADMHENRPIAAYFKLIKRSLNLEIGLNANFIMEIPYYIWSACTMYSAL